MASKTTQSDGLGDLLGELPLDRLREEFQGLGKAVMDKGVSGAGDKIEALTGRLTDVASGSGGGVVKHAAKNLAKGDSPVKATTKAGASAVKDKIKGALGGGGGSGKKMKVTNIIEEIDVPVSRRVAYDKWTQFQDFPGFTKKVENVDQKDDETVEWKAQIFLSHRTWQANIVEQVPDEKIVWKSSGEKGHVDGAVTFHELSPDLTRILVVLEYYPQGFFEKTGNIWRAPGRRFRLELKHFRRELTMNTMQEQDELEGWRGEIRDEETVKSHQDARKEEKQARKSSSTNKSAAAKTSSPAKKSSAAKKSSPARKSPAKKSTSKRTSAAKKSSPAKKTAKKASKRGSTAKRTSKKSTSKRARSSS